MGAVLVVVAVVAVVTVATSVAVAAAAARVASTTTTTTNTTLNTSSNTNSTNSPCQDYFDLPCYAQIRNPAFGATGMCPPPVEALMSVFFVFAASTLPVFGVAVWLVQRNPPSYFMGMDRRPPFRVASIEASVFFAFLVFVCQGASLLYLARNDLVFFEIFRKSEVVFVGLGIAFFLHAFLYPMSTKVPSLRLFISLLPLIPIPPVIEAVAGVWFAALGQRIIAQEKDPRLRDAQRPLRIVDAASSIVSIALFVVFLYWGRQQFLLARMELAPSILNRLRAREADGQLATPASGDDDSPLPSPHAPSPLASAALPTATGQSPPHSTFPYSPLSAYPPLPFQDPRAPNQLQPRGSSLPSSRGPSRLGPTAATGRSPGQSPPGTPPPPQALSSAHSPLPVYPPPRDVNPHRRPSLPSAPGPSRLGPAAAALSPPATPPPQPQPQPQALSSSHHTPLPVYPPPPDDARPPRRPSLTSSLRPSRRLGPTAAATLSPPPTTPTPPQHAPSTSHTFLPVFPPPPDRAHPRPPRRPSLPVSSSPAPNRPPTVAAAGRSSSAPSLSSSSTPASPAAPPPAAAPATTTAAQPAPAGPARVDSLDLIEWQLRGGTVKMIRRVLLWVAAAGVACLACDVWFTVWVVVAGNTRARIEF
ncbi:hypothetical protein DFJ73DRAFT_774403 [Zopfochytrium polystomum]|nr:hypothetical protein DFJ73DRAFT_774403 [Zopfochytrium polystomum]